MLKVGDVLIAQDAVMARFACDLSACLGACCRVGDLGPPLLPGEDDLILDSLEEIRSTAPPETRARIDSLDVIDEFLNRKHLACFPAGPCVFSFSHPEGSLGCQFEQAYNEGRIQFIKPRFCHLFPLVLETFYNQVSINLDRRTECLPAFGLGTGVLEFCKDALVRVFGPVWYLQLEAVLPAARESERFRA